MLLPDPAKEALDAWLGAHTWYAMHGADKQRFFRFVQVLWATVRSPIGEQQMREVITTRAKELARELEPELQQVIHDRVRDLHTILEYYAWLYRQE